MPKMRWINAGIWGAENKSMPFCGVQVDLTRAQQIASADSAVDASKMLRKLKSEQRFNRKP